MNIYYCSNHAGFKEHGGALIYANSISRARELLDIELGARDLPIFADCRYKITLFIRPNNSGLLAVGVGEQAILGSKDITVAEKSS